MGLSGPRAFRRKKELVNSLLGEPVWLEAVSSGESTGVALWALVKTCIFPLRGQIFSNLRSDVTSDLEGSLWRRE